MIGQAGRNAVQQNQYSCHFTEIPEFLVGFRQPLLADAQLEHAAVHYKAGRDVQASAVREVYRALSASASSSVALANTEQKQP